MTEGPSAGADQVPSRSMPASLRPKQGVQAADQVRGPGQARGREVGDWPGYVGGGACSVSNLCNWNVTAEAKARGQGVAPLRGLTGNSVSSGPARRIGAWLVPPARRPPQASGPRVQIGPQWGCQPVGAATHARQVAVAGCPRSVSVRA